MSPMGRKNPGIPRLSEAASTVCDVALILHREASPTALAEQLGSLLASDPLDVFDRELVIAPSPGVERWLSQRLAHELGANIGDDGVCAGLSVHTPYSFMSFALEREFDDPWHPDRLAWLVLEAVDAAVQRPGFETLAHHLGADALPGGASKNDAWFHRARQSRRYAVARRLAGLFARYSDERPALVRAWESGAGGDVAPDLAWQPRLWRDVLDVARAHGIDESPVARLDRVCTSLRDGTLTLSLPRRVNFFGYTRVSTATLDLFEAIAARHETHLWLPHPSDALWQRLRQLDSGGLRRRGDDSARAAEHPLLATLGRDVRELELTLLRRDVEDASAPAAAPFGQGPAGEGSSRGAAAGTRLEQLQADIRANRAPSAVSTIDDTTTFQVHACHGPARQVDALRETLLWLLDESKGSLQPRDIVVMCPDVETYAPLIKAAFASVDDDGAHHPGRRLRVQLADRGLAATNPLAEVALRLLGLAGGRATASEVLDFAHLPAVRQKFGFDTDALDRISRWVRTSGARWGYDAEHRREYGLLEMPANTWTLALDRLALGVAMSADTEAPAGALLPIDDLGTSDIETASAFVTLMTEVTAAAKAVRGTSSSGVDLTRGSFTPQEWFDWLRRHVGAVAAPSRDEAWQLGAFERELAFLAEGSTRTGLRLTDMRVMLEQRWGPRPSRSNFRNGAVSVCTLTPMRSVPHQAVILLGLDDESFPRSFVVDGDDALARDPHLGERDPRSEDRQLLLDAVMASRKHLIAFYSGFDERDGTRRPPAVPLQELIAAAAATGAPTPEDAERHPFEFVHPLQPFDERNFTFSSPLPGGSYDAVALAGARSLRQARESGRDVADETSLPPLLTGLLPAREPRDVTLDELVRFIENPARTFLSDRLQTGVTYEADETEDALPIDLDPLEQWAVGDRLLRRTLSGVPLEQASAEESHSGALPPSPLPSKIGDITRKVGAILQGLPPGERRSIDVSIPLTLNGPSGPTSVRLTGVVPHVIGDEIQIVNYSSVSARHLARAWVSVLAVAASRPGQEWSAAVRGKYGECRLTAPDDPLGALTDLASLRLDGLRAPLPVPAKTSLAFIEGYRTGRRSRNATEELALNVGASKARPVWEGTFDREGERDDPWWQRVYAPQVPSLDRLNAGNVFIDRSKRLWMPLLDQKGPIGR